MPTTGGYFRETPVAGNLVAGNPIAGNLIGGNPVSGGSLSGWSRALSEARMLRCARRVHSPQQPPTKRVARNWPRALRQRGWGGAGSGGRAKAPIQRIDCVNHVDATQS